MTLEELRTHWDMPEARELPDGTVAGIQRLTTTWGLVLGVTVWEWRYRFCYPRDQYSACLADLMKLQTVRDVPDGPWIACRPEVRVGPDGRYPTPAELRELRAKVR